MQPKRERPYDFDALTEARIKAAGNKRCLVCRSVLPGDHTGKCLVCHQPPPPKSWLRTAWHWFKKQAFAAGV